MPDTENVASTRTHSRSGYELYVLVNDHVSPIPGYLPDDKFILLYCLWEGFYILYFEIALRSERIGGLDNGTVLDIHARSPG